MKPAVARRKHPQIGGGGAGGGGGGYVAKAVHFDGNTVLVNSSLVAGADTSFAFFAGWVLVLELQNGYLFVSDPNGSYSNDLNISVSTGGAGPDNIMNRFQPQWGNAAGNNFYNIASVLDPSFAVGVWRFLISAASTNFDTGEKRGRAYIGDVNVTNISHDIGGPFLMSLDALPFYFGGDSFGANLIGDVADFRFQCGTNILDEAGDIPLTTRRLLIDENGKPVNPSVATAVLGVPQMLLSGNSSTFATNQGSGGTFATTGALTNASTSPSD